MSASLAATAPIVLRASDAITLTRDDGSTINVTLDVLRVFMLAPAVPVSQPPPPPAPTVAESTEGATVTTVGPVLTDGAGNSYAINTSGQVVTNGKAEDGTQGRPFTAQVVVIAYHLHLLWQKNKAGNWYVRKGPQSPYVQVPPGHA